MDQAVDPYDERFYAAVGELSPEDLAWRFNNHHHSWRALVPPRSEDEVAGLVAECRLCRRY